MELYFPCQIRALKNFTFGTISISSGETIKVVESSQQASSNRYLSVELQSKNGTVSFTSEALKNALRRGDFELV